MHTKSNPPSSTASTVAANFRLIGWIGFWVELALLVTSGLLLVFAITGRNFSQEAATAAEPATTPGLGIGIFWAIAGIVVLALNLFFAFRYTRIARQLKAPQIEDHPKRADTVRLVRLGVTVGLIGLLLAILGTGATLAILLAKSVSIPQVVGFYNPTRIIRAIDIFVAMANTNLVAANFAATIAALLLLDGLHPRP